MKQGVKNQECWKAIVATANSLRGILDLKPQKLKTGYQLSPGGILNAYREGDLKFQEAVKALERWKSFPS